MQALDNLTGAGQRIPEPTSVEEVSGFLLRAEQQLVDPSTPSLSAASRFALAYEAAHAFALAALRGHGCRPGRGLGHRMVVFSTLPHAWLVTGVAGFPERINPGDKEHRLPGIRKATSVSTPGTADFVDQRCAGIISAGIREVLAAADSDLRL